MSWRLYTPEDWPAVEVLLVQMEQRLGQPMDLPQLDTEPVLVAYVYEQKEDSKQAGQITHVAFLEAEAEIQTLGECPLPLADWDEAGKLLSEVCERYKLRFVRAFIPNQVLKGKRQERPTPVARILQHFGFGRENHDRITCFTRWLSRQKG